MKGITRRVFLTILAVHALAILGIGLWVIIFRDKEILSEFSWNWIISTIIIRWIDYFTAITLSAIAFSFSILLSSSEVRAETKGENSFVRIASGSIILIILVSSFFILTSAFLYGPAKQSVEGILIHSRDAKALVESAKVQAEKQNIAEATRELDHALILAPQYLEAIRLRDQYLVTKAPKMAIGDSAPSQPNVNPVLENKIRVVEYSDQISKAEEFYKAQDYFSALYYVNKAYEKSVGVVPELAELKTRIENAIRGHDQTPGDLDKRKLYDLKQAAIVGSLQNNLPVDAYYQLLQAEQLSREISEKTHVDRKNVGKSGDFQDSDVRKWMPEVLKALAASVFFADELTSPVQRISSGSLMFLNREDGPKREFIYAESLIEGAFGSYLLKPEIILIDGDGKVLEQRKADYGKIVGQNLLLKAIDRRINAEIHEVTVLIGSIPAPLKNTVKIVPSIGNLWDISQGKSGYEGMPIPQQIGLLSILKNLGYDSVPLESVLLMYIVKVLSLGALSFFVMGWAWARRNRYFTLPVFLIALMVVILPIFMFLTTTLYWVLNSALVSCLLILTGFPTTILVVLVGQAILLALSLIYVSGQKAG